LAFLLSGCSPVGDLWASIGNDGDIEFAVCDERNAVEVRVRVQGDDEVAWSTSGRHVFQAGDLFSYGVDPDGLVTNAGPVDLESSDVLVLSILPDANSDESSLRGVFSVSDLTGDDWLAADGRRAAAPCG
jgi:hypothetical protein